MNNLQTPLSEEQKAHLNELGKYNNRNLILINYRFETLSASHSSQIL